MFAILNLHVLRKDEFKHVLEMQLSLYAENGGWYSINLNSGGDSSAVYKPIPRLFGADPDGLLYIGGSTDLETRVRNLFEALLSPAARAHDVGGLWHRNPRLQEHCPLSRLTINVSPCADPKVAESKLLQAYTAEFGEAPPLNVRCR